jgi:putative pyruvate formate lyase activating enzyme
VNELTACRLCPRACGADRAAGKTGFCGAGAMPRVFRYGPHFGEEPPLTGTRGSGAVFFSHCTMRCIYCQNSPWSQGGKGDDITVEALGEIFRGLATKHRCHNWNLVSPTPWLPQIREAVAPLLKAGIRLPFVYNTSGFESEQTLEAFPELADIALCDLRYDTEDAAEEGSGTRAYVEAAHRTLLWFWNHLGPLECDGDDIARRGVICRLLVLPGHADEAVGCLRWLAREVGTDIAISVMAQYTPVYRALEKAPWNRPIRKDEYEKVTDEFETLGFENGWVQELDSAEPSDLLGQEMPSGEGAVGKHEEKAGIGKEE